MKILIKNMVSNRCIMMVKSVFEEMNLQYESVELGEVVTTRDINEEKLKVIDNYLRSVGLELLDNRKKQIVEKIKNAIIELVNCPDEEMKVILSDYLSQKLNYNTTYLSNLFSESEGQSIMKYYIRCKIEHVKELLLNEKLNLKEISYITKYSSVSHLSNQFKKTTGLAPLQFRQLRNNSQRSTSQISY